MVKEILSMDSIAGKKTRPVITGKHNGAKKTVRDLLDTASYYAETLSIKGLTANVIGVNQRVMICLLTLNGKTSWVSMINPMITDHSSNTITKKGINSDGSPRIIERYTSIVVSFIKTNGQHIILELSGDNTEIVQQQIDRLNGEV